MTLVWLKHTIMIQILKRSNSNNVNDKLLQLLSTHHLGDTIQVFIDDPSVHWDLFRRHSKYREENEFSKNLNIASSGLHVIHGALRTDMMEVDREIRKVLHAIWKMSDESSASRVVYIRASGCNTSVVLLQNKVGRG